MVSTLSIYERTRELGLLRAAGTTRGQLRSIEPYLCATRAITIRAGAKIRGLSSPHPRAFGSHLRRYGRVT
jgi:hypothetical protein